MLVLKKPGTFRGIPLPEMVGKVRRIVLLEEAAEVTVDVYPSPGVLEDPAALPIRTEDYTIRDDPGEKRPKLVEGKPLEIEVVRPPSTAFTDFSKRRKSKGEDVAVSEFLLDRPEWSGAKIVS